MVEQVTRPKPDLVILAFGMNDSAGRSAEEYGTNTAAMISKIRESLPDAEFILVASMLGNRDWVLLKHDVFPQYRDQLAKLCKPGIGLADMTSVWNEFFKRKKDHDLTGNGVNHPTTLVTVCTLRFCQRCWWNRSATNRRRAVAIPVYS